jgi:hypothetical protein
MGRVPWVADWSKMGRWTELELELELGFILRPTVSRPVRLGIGLPFEAHPYPFSSEICFVVLPVGRPL